MEGVWRQEPRYRKSLGAKETASRVMRGLKSWRVGHLRLTTWGLEQGRVEASGGWLGNRQVMILQVVKLLRSKASKTGPTKGWAGGQQWGQNSLLRNEADTWKQGCLEGKKMKQQAGTEEASRHRIARQRRLHFWRSEALGSWAAAWLLILLKLCRVG